eukprot:GILK01006394.1.p1 GENE.GILK01006394.1~~GILK01006394.1.p1  ORF type:complete len:372 (+),score=46.71 GILK01006394.1:45-1160(+)
MKAHSNARKRPSTADGELQTTREKKRLMTSTPKEESDSDRDDGLSIAQPDQTDDTVVMYRQPKNPLNYVVRSGRMYTVSIALPDTIINNAQSPELRSHLVSQIARAAAIFNVDEIVIYRETPVNKIGQKQMAHQFDPALFFARNLQYLETPQYLRKSFFPVHPDLRNAGLMYPLDSPHHMRIDEQVKYREGVVLDRPTSSGEGSWVNCGMRKDVKIDKRLKTGVRVTVEILQEKKRYVQGRAVSPSTPKEQDGLYWGYQTRVAETFSQLFTSHLYPDGYDCTIGISEKGKNVESLPKLPQFKHLLVVFGGLTGLEDSVGSDETMKESNLERLFTFHVNSTPLQGTRMVRTEESVLISLSSLRPFIVSAHSS